MVPTVVLADRYEVFRQGWMLFIAKIYYTFGLGFWSLAITSCKIREISFISGNRDRVHALGIHLIELDCIQFCQAFFFDKNLASALWLKFLGYILHPWVVRCHLSAVSPSPKMKCVTVPRQCRYYWLVCIDLSNFLLFS